ITITASFGGRSAQTNLTVTAATTTSVAVGGSGGAPTLVGAGPPANLRASTASGGGPNTSRTATYWVSGNTNIATVSGGVVTGVAPGQTSITASFGGQSGSLIMTVQAVPTPSLVLSGSYSFNTDTGDLTPQVGGSSKAPGWTP